MPLFHKDKSSDSLSLNLVNGPPPPYVDGARPRSPKWHPRNWTLCTKVVVVVLALIIVIAIIVGAVVGSRDNRYPAYSKLNYEIQDTYEGSDFFNNFDYFTGYDPSSGFVHYVDQPGSQQLNLTFASATSAVLRVDTSDQDASTGRKSVRIESKNQYNNGLFIFDILHTPFGCGTWPALWLTDQANWPTNGEIDVVEAVNAATTGNQMTLHTTNGCTMNGKRKETGKALTTSCLNSTDNNAGCGVQGADDTYGQTLNSNGGGIYAMEWRSDGIRMWFFSRSSIPSDISNDTSPDPSSWGTPLADFPNIDCSIGQHFRNESIIANIDLCGSWAGEQTVFAQGGCPGTCEQLVTSQPAAFDDAYWEWKSFKVYQASS